MSAATPMHDVRRVPFSERLPRESRLSSASALPPSPYTPFSGRRSGYIPSGAPAVSRSNMGSGDPRTAESADAFARGGADLALRAITVDVISVILQKEHDPQPERRFVSEIRRAIEDQMTLAQSFMKDRAIHPHVRRGIQKIWEALRIERETWMLIETTWRDMDIRTKDLSSRRAAPDFQDSEILKSTPGLFKAKVIAEWLEKIADEDLTRRGGAHVKPLNDLAYRWGYTASQHGSTLSMDFPLQDAHGLGEIENKAEERLCSELFRVVRAGRMEEAEEICRAVGQPWRAAVLAGGKNVSTMSSNGHKAAARTIWRKAVAAMAVASAPIPPHERALYGVLSGVAPPALAVAESYEDQAWVRFTCLIDTISERALTGKGETPCISDDSILQLFRDCEGAAKAPEGFSSDILSQIRAVRSFLALGRRISMEHIGGLLKALSELAKTGFEQEVEWVCRLAAQICVCLKFSTILSHPLQDPEVVTYFEDAVQYYPRLVIKKDLEEEARSIEAGTIPGVRPLVVELAAQVLAQLVESKNIVNVFSVLLCAALRGDLQHEHAEAQRVGVKPREVHDRRTLCLQQAGQCFDRETLDALVISAVESTWDSHMPLLPDDERLDSSLVNKNLTTFENVSNDDKLVIRAIEFLMYPGYPNHEESIRRATCAARRFFLMGKRASAREVVTWFPANVLAQLPEGACRTATHELDCWKIYMDAVARHNDWNVYFFSNCPAPLPDRIREAANARPGQVSYEVQAAANVQYERFVNEMENYIRISQQTRDAAIEALRGALTFSGGWMCDLQMDIPEEDVPNEHPDDGALREESATQRLREIAAVRKIAIPQLAALYHHVLHESQLYEEATVLAQLIADDTTRLYESFTKQDLKAFLKRVAESAIYLADATAKSGVQRPYEGYFFEEFA